MTRPGLLPAGREHLRHGYRIDDARRRALMAANSRYAARTLPHHERVDAAWYGIVEHLYAATQCPSPTGLCDVGVKAVNDASRRADHHAGVDRVNRRPMPKFVLFWAPRTVHSHEDAVVERLALRQVLALVSAEQRDALVALAVFGDRDAAATALGLGQGGLDSRLRRARQVIYAAWFEGQTPAPRRRDRRVGSYRKAVSAP